MNDRRLKTIRVGKNNNGSENGTVEILICSNAAAVGKRLPRKAK